MLVLGAITTQEDIMKRPLASLTILAALAALPAAAQDQPLTGDAIQTLLSGNTAIADDDSYRQTFAADGTTIYAPAGGDPDAGLWRIEGDQYCSQWAGGGWDCYDVEGTADHIIWISGDSRFAAAIVQGEALED